MNRIDLTPLYRSSVGFDRFESLLDAAFQSEKASAGYPPYNIEALEDDHYAITLAVAGFTSDELDIQVEKGVLTIVGKKEATDSKGQYLHQGIATRAFERKFNLADHIEVIGADLKDGLLNIRLLKEVPEAMKPKTISIGDGNRTSARVLDHKREEGAA